MIVVALAVAALALLLAGASLFALRRSRASELRHRILLANLPQTALALYDTELRLQLVAGASLRASSLGQDELVGRRLSEVVPPDQLGMLTSHYEPALRGESSSIEYSSTADGREYWLLVVPVRDGDRVVGGLAISQDITERKRVERRHELAEGRRRLMVDVMNEAYVAVDADGTVVDWNDRATKIFGYSRQEAMGSSTKELILPPEDHAAFDRLIERFLRGERRGQRLDLQAERGAIRKDGSRFTVDLFAASLEHEGVVTMHTFMNDITARKRSESDAEAHAADLSALAETTGALARSTTPAEARNAICQAASAIADSSVSVLFEPEPGGSGLRVTGVIGADVAGDLLPFVGQPSGAVRAFAGLEPVFVADTEADANVDQRMVEKTGARSAFFVPVVQDQTPLGVIVAAWREHRPELSERVRQTMGLVAAEAAVAIERASLLDRLSRMARTDDLTGLPNRRAWDEEIDREIARARRDGVELTIAMVDLDRFKDYNDVHGHQAGDRLLKQAAGAWRGVLRETDLLARYGGEEFAIALPSCDAAAAAELVDRLRGATPGEQACSAGLATWDRKEAIDHLVGRADRALYAAKQGGRDRTVSG